ncbi:MAG: hypothetical protein SNH88_06795 [Rikenellaceae bacterium]
MKKNSTIICSMVGGAMLSTAILCLLKSKKGREMREGAHKMILDEIESLKAKFRSLCGCTDEDCQCDIREQDGEQSEIQPQSQN